LQINASRANPGGWLDFFLKKFDKELDDDHSRG
jgi:hypothetical protein